MSKTSTWALALTLLLWAAGAGDALAASCCGGANGSDGFVLPKWERAMVGGMLRMEDTLDLRDDAGNALRTQSWRSTETRVTLGGAYRLLNDLQVSAALPFLVKRVATNAAVSSGLGLGDAGLQVRYEIIDEETCVVRPVSELSWFDLKPSLHWVTSLAAPTGRATGESYDKRGLGADVTGRGIWIGDTGLELTKIWGRFGNAVQATAGYQSAYDGRDAQTPGALRWSAGAGLLYFFAFQHSLTLMVNHRQELYQREAQLAARRTITTTATTLTWNRIFAENGLWLRATVGQAGYLQGRNTPMLYDGTLQLSKLIQ